MLKKIQGILKEDPFWSGGKMEAVEADIYPGLKVAIEHKLAPRGMKLTIYTPRDESDTLYGPGLESLGAKADYKYIFEYTYLDLSFTIRTYDDKIAAQLYPFFSDAQKTQIMAMTLGSKTE